MSIPAGAQAPAPYEATPELIEAAKKEGKVVWYTATDVQVAEKAAKAFEAKYPGVKVQVERSGSERVFQRINQEYGSKIYNADVIETSDAVHFVLFKRQGWLQPAVPADVAKHWPSEVRDADGQYAAYRAAPFGDRLQLEAGEGGRCPEEPQGSARSEMARAHRQGPSRL